MVYTRQGNPAWAGQERDGQTPIRSDDLFFGGAGTGLGQPGQGRDPAGRRAAAAAGQPDRGDEPRPQAAAAVLVLPAQHQGGRGGDRRRPRQRRHRRAVRPVRGQQPGRLLGRPTGSAPGSRRYIYPSTPLTQRAGGRVQRGRVRDRPAREQRLHRTSPRPRWPSDYASQLGQLGGRSTPACRRPVTNRFHCIVWSATGPPSRRSSGPNGIRLDTNYYYWPGSWVAEPAGVHDRLRHADALRRHERQR